MATWELTYSGKFTGPTNNRRWNPGWWVAVNRKTGKQVSASALVNFQSEYFRAGNGLPKYLGKQSRSKNLKWWDQRYQRAAKVQRYLDKHGKTMTGLQWLAEL